MRDHTIELLERSWPAAFSYNDATQTFHSGAQQFTPEEIPLEHGALSAEITKLGDKVSIPNAPLVQTVLDPVMLPQFYDWLDANWDDALAEATVSVMRDVFVRLEPPSIIPLRLDRDYIGFMGFDVRKLSREYPHIMLQTIGNCACLGVDGDGVYGRLYWEDNIAKFTFHNVDTRAQGVSLLAGLGHLARLASD